MVGTGQVALRLLSANPPLMGCWRLNGSTLIARDRRVTMSPTERADWPVISKPGSQCLDTALLGTCTLIRVCV